MSNYGKANTSAQWYADNYPGAQMDPNVDVLHTTESTGWPSYQGGATAPNYTARPNFRRKRLDWRAHFPDEMSSRALRNEAGGVETNTLNCRQVELVGTCDPRHRRSWAGAPRYVEGRDYLYWPEAPEWALRDVADFLADGHTRHGIKLQAPALWLPYPESYGATRARMSFSEWRNFYGICGHQHVPENTHGDPGDLDVGRILDIAKGEEDMPYLDWPKKDRDAMVNDIRNAILHRDVGGGDKRGPFVRKFLQIWNNRRR